MQTPAVNPRREISSGAYKQQQVDVNGGDGSDASSLIAIKLFDYHRRTVRFALDNLVRPVPVLVCLI